MIEIPSGYFLASGSEHWTYACWSLGFSLPPVSLFPCFPASLFPSLSPNFPSLSSSLLFSSSRLLACLCILWLECLRPLISHSCHRAVLDSFHHCSAHLCTLSHYACFYDFLLLACMSCRTYACPSCCVTYRANATDIERVKCLVAKRIWHNGNIVSMNDIPVATSIYKAHFTSRIFQRKAVSCFDARLFVIALCKS